MSHITGTTTQSSTSAIDFARLTLDDNTGHAGEITVSLSAVDGTYACSAMQKLRYLAVRADSSDDVTFGCAAESLYERVITAGSLVVQVGVSRVLDTENKTVTFRATPSVLTGSPTSLTLSFSIDATSGGVTSLL